MAKYATCLKVLMILAVEVGKASLSGDSTRLEEAEKNLKAYEDLVRKSDRVFINMARGKFLPKEKI